MTASCVSEITYQDVAEYIHLTDIDASDQNTLESLIGVAKSFVRNYTGQADLDAYQDFVIVVLILCQDMWDNRTMYVDSGNLSHVVQTILGMHSVNLL